MDVNEPTMPRKRKVNKRFELGAAEQQFPKSVSEHYRHQYFEAFDLVIHCVEDRFDQPSLQLLINVEELIVKAVKCKYEMFH